LDHVANPQRPVEFSWPANGAAAGTRQRNMASARVGPLWRKA
jgi:hypothetical protein